MARFTVVDVYDFHETLIETDDLNVAYKAALTRMEDTYGECAVVIQDSKTASIGGCMEYVAIDFCGEDE